MINFRNSPRITYCAGWALLGIYNFLRGVFLHFGPWWHGLVYNAAWFSIWAVLGLITLRMLRRYPLRMDWRPWAIHLALAISLTAIDVALGQWIGLQLTGYGGKVPFIDVVVFAISDCFSLGFLHYCGFVGVVVGLDNWTLAQQRKLQAEEYKTAFVRAQLQSLKSQLQPHFLFNTLHAIASLMHYDVPTAERMLTRLSELLRISLRESASSVVSLKQEMAFIEAYLDIEKIRFENRLDVTWTIPDDLRDSAIPPFILQPLVENAIKFSVAPHAAGGKIVIRAYSEKGALLLEVEDNAPAPTLQKYGFGIGLSNTRSRLETLYGADQGLELIRAGMGTIARIRLPLHSPVAMAA